MRILEIIKTFNLIVNNSAEKMRNNLATIKERVDRARVKVKMR